MRKLWKIFFSFKSFIFQFFLKIFQKAKHIFQFLNFPIFFTSIFIFPISFCLYACRLLYCVLCCCRWMLFCCAVCIPLCCVIIVMILRKFIYRRFSLFNSVWWYIMMYQFFSYIFRFSSCVQIIFNHKFHTYWYSILSNKNYTVYGNLFHVFLFLLCIMV